jgi:hypothetical protein
MSDNMPKTHSRFFAWLPVASLALSAAAFGLGAPARLARTARSSSPLSASLSAEVESVMRYEPVMFPMPASARKQGWGDAAVKRIDAYMPRGSRRLAHEIIGRSIAATH